MLRTGPGTNERRCTTCRGWVAVRDDGERVVPALTPVCACTAPTFETLPATVARIESVTFGGAAATAIVAKEQGASVPMFEARAATASDATRRERDVAVERAQKAAGDVVVEAAKINDTMHYIVIAVPKAPSLTGVCGVVWSSGMRRDARVSTVDAVARALKDVP